MDGRVTIVMRARTSRTASDRSTGRAVARPASSSDGGDRDGPQAVLGVDDRRDRRRGRRARNASSSAASGSARRDRQLDDLALERRRVAADQARVRRVGRPGERQALGQVVELEHALLADDDELAALGRRQPVDVEHAGRARTGSGAARTAGPRGRRGSAGRSRRRRATAARRRSSDRMSTSWVARSTVTPTSRIRAGNGPARRLTRSRRRVDSQPAVEQPAELEDGRVEPLDVTDLDRDARARGRGDDPHRLLDRRRERLLDEDRRSRARSRRARAARGRSSGRR